MNAIMLLEKTQDIEGMGGVGGGPLEPLGSKGGKKTKF